MEGTCWLGTRLARQINFSSCLSVLASLGLYIRFLNRGNVSQPLIDGAPFCGFWITGLRASFCPVILTHGNENLGHCSDGRAMWGATRGSLPSCTPKPWPSHSARTLPHSYFIEKLEALRWELPQLVITKSRPLSHMGSVSIVDGMDVCCYPLALKGVAPTQPQVFPG